MLSGQEEMHKSEEIHEKIEVVQFIIWDVEWKLGDDVCNKGEYKNNLHQNYENFKI
jgi:hypothetical protein